MEYHYVGNKAKGRISKKCVTRKQSATNFPKNEHFLPPDTHPQNRHFLHPDTHECVSGGKKRLFSGKFGVLCFFVRTVLRSAFLPYYRRLRFLAISCVMH